MLYTAHPLSAVDSAWLHMDDPTNLAMITGVALLDGPIDAARFRRTLEARLLPLDRFTMRVIENSGLLGGPRWEVDPHFALDAHIHRVALPAPGDMTALQEFLGDLASTPLDYSKPRWQVHLVENVLGGAAVVMRFHHCIGNGTAMTAVLARLTDTAPDVPIEPPAEPVIAYDAWDPLRAVLAPATAAIHSSLHLAGALFHEATTILRQPAHLLDLVGTTAGSAAALGRVLLLPPDPTTPFKGTLGVQKRVAWSAPVPLDDVKRLAKRAGAKVNDALLTVVAGALRAYLIGRGAPVGGLEIHAMVPVDLRPPERALELDNTFGLVFLALPLGLANPLERLAIVKRRMDAIKRSPEALASLGVLNVVGRLPAAIEAQVTNLFCSRATAIMTNVRGPAQPRYLAGNKIANMMFWSPQAGGLGMGVSILSYNGMVTLGVIADAGLVPDPQTITARFEQEYATLCMAVPQA